MNPKYLKEPLNRVFVYDLNTIQIGDVRDLDIFDDMLFVATESRGIYIYEIFSNSIETFLPLGVDQLYKLIIL